MKPRGSNLYRLYVGAVVAATCTSQCTWSQLAWAQNATQPLPPASATKSDVDRAVATPAATSASGLPPAPPGYMYVPTTPPAAAAAPASLPPAPPGYMYVPTTPPAAAAAPASLPPAPPGYMYVPNSQGPAVRNGAQLPSEIDYQSGDPIPPGYHLREESRSGLVIAGYILTGIPYGLSAMVALSANFKNSSGYLLIPYAGPWLTMGRRNYTDCHRDNSTKASLDCVADVFVVMGLIMDGVIQASGGTLLLTGSLATKKTLVRNTTAWSAGPQRVGNGYGLGMVGVF